MQTPRDDADINGEMLIQGPTFEGNAHGMRMHELQQQIGAGEYRVDTNAVADVILRRLMAGQLRAAAPRADAPDAG